MKDGTKEMSQKEIDQEMESPNSAEPQAMDASESVSQSSDAAAAQEVAPLKSLDDSAAHSLSGTELDMESLMDVPVTLSVEIGRKRMPINQLVSLSPGSIVDLNRELDSPLDLFVNGTLIARGEVVVMGKKFGLRLVDICSANERMQGIGA